MTTYVQAINEALREEMERDPLTFVMGEDVVLSAFGATKGLVDKFGLERVRNTAFDVLITDVVMPEMNGIELAKTIKSISPKTRVVLLSGQAETRDLVAQAQHEGHGFELWAKPMHPDVILERLKQGPV